MMRRGMVSPLSNSLPGNIVRNTTELIEGSPHAFRIIAEEAAGRRSPLRPLGLELFSYFSKRPVLGACPHHSVSPRESSGGPSTPIDSKHAHNNLEAIERRLVLGIAHEDTSPELFQVIEHKHTARGFPPFETL